MNREFILKMAEAKKMERDAMMSLLPQSSRGHIETIGKEVEAMWQESARDHQDELLEMIRLLMECRTIFSTDNSSAPGTTQSDTNENSKARKVDIA